MRSNATSEVASHVCSEALVDQPKHVYMNFGLPYATFVSIAPTQKRTHIA